MAGRDLPPPLNEVEHVNELNVVHLRTQASGNRSIRPGVSAASTDCPAAKPSVTSGTAPARHRQTGLARVYGAR